MTCFVDLRISDQKIKSLAPERISGTSFKSTNGFPNTSVAYDSRDNFSGQFFLSFGLLHRVLVTGNLVGCGKRLSTRSNMRRHKKTHLGTASPPTASYAHSPVPTAVAAPAIIALNPPPHVGPTLQGSATSGVLDAPHSSLLPVSSITLPDSINDVSAANQILTLSALDLPRSDLEHLLPETLQMRNQNIREKMTEYLELCRESGDSPSQIKRKIGMMAGQLYLPSPLSSASTSRSSGPQSCSSATTFPLEQNSQEPLSQTPNHGLTLQGDAPSAPPLSTPAQQTVPTTSSFQERDANTSSSESVTMVSTGTQTGFKNQCPICFHSFKNSWYLGRHTGDMHKPR